MLRVISKDNNNQNAIIYGTAPSLSLFRFNNGLDLTFESRFLSKTVTGKPSETELQDIYVAFGTKCTGVLFVVDSVVDYFKQSFKNLTGKKADKVFDITVIGEEEVVYYKEFVMKGTALSPKFEFVKVGAKSSKLESSTILSLRRKAAILKEEQDEKDIDTVFINNNSGIAPKDVVEKTKRIEIKKVASWEKAGMLRWYVDTTKGSLYLDYTSKKFFTLSGFDHEPDMSIIKQKVLDFTGYKTIEEFYNFRGTKVL